MLICSYVDLIVNHDLLCPINVDYMGIGEVSFQKNELNEYFIKLKRKVRIWKFISELCRNEIKVIINKF